MFPGIAWGARQIVELSEIEDLAPQLLPQLVKRLQINWTHSRPDRTCVLPIVFQWASTIPAAMALELSWAHCTNTQH